MLDAGLLVNLMKMTVNPLMLTAMPLKTQSYITGIFFAMWWHWVL